MKEYCQILIENKNNKPNGRIFGFDKVLSFDPTTILADLRFTEHLFLDYNLVPFDDWDYAFEYGFAEKIKIQDKDREQYHKLIITIRKIIEKSNNTHNTINLSTVELLRTYFDITNHFIPSNLIPNFFAKIATDAASENIMTVHYSHYSIEDALACDVSKFHSYFYECYSLADAVFSILHFLALGRYKFKKCLHCGKYFATQTDKQKYCLRNSPYPGYTHLNCEQAVRNISQDFKRSYKRIYNNLSQNHNDDMDTLNAFLSDYSECVKVFKKEPNTQNINYCFYILKEKRWY